jgi:hypothetical protein
VRCLPRCFGRPRTPAAPAGRYRHRPDSTAWGWNGTIRRPGAENMVLIPPDTSCPAAQCQVAYRSDDQNALVISLLEGGAGRPTNARGSPCSRSTKCRRPADRAIDVHYPARWPLTNQAQLSTMANIADQRRASWALADRQLPTETTARRHKLKQFTRWLAASTGTAIGTNQPLGWPERSR